MPLAKPKRPYILDIEASSLSSSSYPIEVGVALDNGQKFCRLIKPAKDWVEWNEEAEKTHKITRKILLTYGKNPHEVAEDLNNLLAGYTLYSDGWVVDKPWLTSLFYEAGLDMKFQLSPLETILSESQMNIWHETKDEILKNSNITRHRASSDAWLIQETYAQTLQASQV